MKEKKQTLFGVCIAVYFYNAFNISCHFSDLFYHITALLFIAIL